MSDLKNAEWERYKANAHAMQSGVAYDITSNGLKAAAADPKNLRVGVNSSLIDTATIAKLLIAKGIFTEQEFFTALADQMKEEVERYQASIEKQTGSKVTLA